MRAVVPVCLLLAGGVLGPAPAAATPARRVGALLEVMAHDRFPAVRHLAWRSLRRLVAPDARPGQGLAADYDPSGTVEERGRVVARLKDTLGPAARPPETALVALRSSAGEDDLEVGQ